MKGGTRHMFDQFLPFSRRVFRQSFFQSPHFSRYLFMLMVSPTFEGMHCGACKALIAAAAQRTPGAGPQHGHLRRWGVPQQHRLQRGGGPERGGGGGRRRRGEPPPARRDARHNGRGRAVLRGCPPLPGTWNVAPLTLAF